MVVCSLKGLHLNGEVGGLQQQEDEFRVLYYKKLGTVTACGWAETLITVRRNESLIDAKTVSLLRFAALPF
jgi:hypothetical protein